MERLRRKYSLDYSLFFAQELRREELRAGVQPVRLLPEGEFAVLRKAVAGRYATSDELETYRLQMAARRQPGRSA